MSRSSDSESGLDEKNIKLQSEGNSTKDIKENSLEDKRPSYACGKDYVPINKIERWPEYCRKEAESLLQLNKKISTKYKVDEQLNSKVAIWSGDITRLEIDAIVNAANKTLLGGGGVDGAIHSAAGPGLYEECKLLSGCSTGEAKTTRGYKLPANYVIHTVGPRDRSESKLRSCYKSCFNELHKLKLRSIAFCCISTGIYGYPNSEAVHVALDETRKHLMSLKEEGQLSRIDLIVFCLFLNIDLKLYQKEMQNYFPVAQSTTGNFESDISQNLALNRSSNSLYDAMNTLSSSTSDNMELIKGYIGGSKFPDFLDDNKGSMTEKSMQMDEDGGDHGNFRNSSLTRDRDTQEFSKAIKSD